MTKASKFLSLVLRHKPEVAGLTLDKSGWADVGQVVAALRTRFGTYSRRDLVELVESNDKKRFSFDAHGQRIRANQGHSFDVDLQLEPQNPPALLYHGTKADFLTSILRDGLSPQSRQHVHLSPDIETAKIVASRRKGRSVLLTIDTTVIQGQAFFQSDNGVWLTDQVPPEAMSVSYPWE